MNEKQQSLRMEGYRKFWKSLRVVMKKAQNQDNFLLQEITV